MKLQRPLREGIVGGLPLKPTSLTFGSKKKKDQGKKTTFKVMSYCHVYQTNSCLEAGIIIKSILNFFWSFLQGNNNRNGN